MATNPAQRLFGPGSWAEAGRIGTILRTETTGGVLLLVAAALALIWANSPWADGYRSLSGVTVGGLSLAAWAADERDDQAKIGVLVGSVIAAALAAVLLRMRNRHYRGLCERESVDTDADGVPDVYHEQA